MKTKKSIETSRTGHVRECAGFLLIAPYDPELVEESENTVGLSPTLIAAIVDSRKGKSSIPKGGIRENESPKQAAERETREETGLNPDRVIGYLGNYERDEFSKTGDFIGRVVVRVYLAFIDEPLLLEPLADDVTNARWIDVRNVPHEVAHPEAQAFFRTILESYGIVVEEPVSLAQKRHS